MSIEEGTPLVQAPAPPKYSRFVVALAFGGALLVGALTRAARNDVAHGVAALDETSECFTGDEKHGQKQGVCGWKGEGGGATVPGCGYQHGDKGSPVCCDVVASAGPLVFDYYWCGNLDDGAQCEHDKQCKTDYCGGTCKDPPYDPICCGE